MAELLVGVDDPLQTVGAFFDSFAWEGSSLDAETLSAEAFLLALGDS